MTNPRTLILGIGNLLWADEGFGVRTVEEMDRRYVFDDGVTVMDGGTQGLYLVQYVKDTDRLIVFDAIDFGEKPGTLIVVRDDEVPRFRGCRKLSLHQTGFQDVIAGAALLGHVPAAMTLIGVQAEQLDDWGGSLTDSVRAQIEPAIALALAELAGWGVGAALRAEPLAPSAGLVGNGMDMAGYERRTLAPCA